MINTGYLFHERRAVQCTCISAFYTLNLKKLKVLIMEKQKGQAFVIAHGCKYEYPSYICNMLTATLIGAQNMVSMWPVNIKLCQLITAPHPLWPWIIKFCVGFYLHVSHQEMGSGHGVLVKKTIYYANSGIQSTKTMLYVLHFGIVFCCHMFVNDPVQ